MTAMRFALGTAIAACTLACGCSGPELDSIHFTQGGAACFSASDCVTLHGVEAPGTLVLEDSAEPPTFC